MVTASPHRQHSAGDHRARQYQYHQRYPSRPGSAKRDRHRRHHRPDPLAQAARKLYCRGPLWPRSVPRRGGTRYARPNACLEAAPTCQHRIISAEGVDAAVDLDLHGFRRRSENYLSSGSGGDLYPFRSIRCLSSSSSSLMPSWRSFSAPSKNLSNSFCASARFFL